MSSQQMSSQQQHHGTVLQWARQFAIIRASIPEEQQKSLETLWRSIRQALNTQHAEIDEIRRIAATARFTLPERPPTSNSVEECRAAVGRALDDAAAEVGEASAIAFVLKDLDPSWTRDLVKRLYCTPLTTTKLGCWISKLAPAHPNGYIKVNLRNTPYKPQPEQPERKLGIQPFLHQLAIVGKGQGLRLPLTTGAGGYEVSHLCHNSGCFNPEHLVVERAALNKARNACRGRAVLEIESTMRIHPCPHWDDAEWNNGADGLRMQCVLPVLKISKAYLGKNIDVGVEGRLRTRG